ncbi:MAG: Na+/H+ antiporter subunit B [Acidiferrobacterales bacterium]|nr:Na+/H+ antiporter subunit B [Acidiferrobacterales bacterium]
MKKSDTSDDAEATKNLNFNSDISNYSGQNFSSPKPRKIQLAHAEADSLILRTATLIVLPLQLLFSVFLLLRGHDEPGGGFIGGLVASGALALYVYAFGANELKRLLRISPKDLLAIGLILGLLATLPSVLFGEAFFTAQWLKFSLGENLIKLSTVLVFDIGVYLTVIGTLVTMFLALTETQTGEE